jgi:hypothetical protein
LKEELELDLVENRFTNGSSIVTSKNIGKLEISLIAVKCKLEN